MRHHRFLLLLMMAAVVGCGDSGEPLVANVETLDVPAGVDSLAPQLFTSGDRVALSWLEADEGGHALRYALWEDERWSAARTVASGSDWFANWADLPGVRPLARGGWLAWWLQKSAPDTYAYDVRLARSEDGVEWRELGSPHDDGTPSEHGFVTVFDHKEGFGLAWLDGRHTLPDAHAHHGAGGMTLRYAAYANDTKRAEDEIDALTCDCCQTDSALTRDGVVLAYRDRTETEVRDIKVVRWRDGAWSRPTIVHDDGWTIDGCPVNGPAIAADDQRVGVAWFTAPGGKAEVRFAQSVDGGVTFGPPVRIDEGRPLGRVDVVFDGARALITWMEQVDGRAQVRLRAVDDDGAVGDSASLALTGADRGSGFPRMARLRDGSLLLVWTYDGNDARRLGSARVTLR